MILRIGLGKAFLDARGRRFTQQTKHYNPVPAEVQARNNFLQTQPAELFPDDNRQRTDDHPRQRTVARHA